MRTEQEMMDLIEKFVVNDPNIRVAVLNGSRANPNAASDPFQDFDISCYVRDVQPFKADRGFLDQFGELMIMQSPEDIEDPPPANDGHHVYLMQFTDGNRIDLSFCPVDWLRTMKHESLTMVLVEKDGGVQDLPPPSDKDFLPEEPSAKSFDDCCNEFWWVCPYVAKALWREELFHAKSLLEKPIRTPLMKMVTWHFAIKTGYEVAPGKDCKNIRPVLDPDLWAKLESTYSDSEISNTWDSLFSMGDVFRITARHVAQEYGFDYRNQEDCNVTDHLRHVRQLPKEAKTIYD